MRRLLTFLLTAVLIAAMAAPVAQAADAQKLVVNIGDSENPNYVPVADVATPDGYELDPTVFNQYDPNETVFSFAAKDESAQLRSIFYCAYNAPIGVVVPSAFGTFKSAYGPENVSRLTTTRIAGSPAQYFTTLNYQDSESGERELIQMVHCIVATQDNTTVFCQAILVCTDEKPAISSEAVVALAEQMVAGLTLTPIEADDIFPLVGASSLPEDTNWIVLNVGEADLPRYQKVGEVKTPDGFMRDLTTSYKNDINETDFYFVPILADSAFRMVYIRAYRTTLAETVPWVVDMYQRLYGVDNVSEAVEGEYNGYTIQYLVSQTTEQGEDGQQHPGLQLDCYVEVREDVLVLIQSTRWVNDTMPAPDDAGIEAILAELLSNIVLETQ